MNKKLITLHTAVIAFFALVPQRVFAATGGGSLPWETPLATVQASLTGPVAVSVALIAIAVAGAMLIFGGEINNFARMGVYIVLVLGLLVMANNFLSALYTTGATIPEQVAYVNQPAQPTSVIKVAHVHR